MKIINTAEQRGEIPVYMLLYGVGGIGKSTFASTAPKPFMADCENGSKYFALRGIKLNVAMIETWFDFAGPDQFVDMAIKSKCETIIVDPIGELMEKCKASLTGKYVQADGSPTMAGWGELKARIIAQLRKLRDSGKNVILIGHVEEKEDEGRLVKRPKVQTKISEDIVNMVDIVAYMYGKPGEDGKTERVISVDPSNDKIVAKDRTGQLPPVLPPSFSAIKEALEAAIPEPTNPAAEAAAAATSEGSEEKPKAPGKLESAKAKLEAAAQATE